MQKPETRPEGARGPDLSRLRIERGSQPLRPYRGFPLVLVLVLVALGALLWLFRAPLLGAVQGVGAPQVDVAPVVRVVPGQAQEGDVAANGYVVADRTASLATALSGRLVELHAEEGDTVEEDAVVARIQYDDLEAQEAAAAERVTVAAARLAAARADLGASRLEFPRIDALIETQRRQAAEAQSNLDRLDRDVVRNRPLFDTGRIDEGTWDRVQADARAARDAWQAALATVRATEAQRGAWEGEVQCREKAVLVAEAEVASARKDVEIAAIAVEKTRIRAPFRGLVIRKDAELGEVIAPTGAGNARGSVFTIVDPKSLEVQVELSERRILSVREGDEATVFLDAAPDQGHAGSVRKIWPRADRSKGTIEVRVAFAQRPEIARPEMSVRVVFRGKTPVATGAPYLTVPAGAVVRRGGGTFAFVLEGETVRLRPVTLGEPKGQAAVIEDGVQAGERVVVDPAADLKDGDKVRLRESR